jgi:hypothetical protein
MRTTAPALKCAEAAITTLKAARIALEAKSAAAAQGGLLAR